MARGGFRAGAGRPKKARPDDAATVPPEVKRAARQAKVSPLEYMLDVMNDADADKQRRDRMAIAAAPFVHARAADVEPGKREQRTARAKAAAASGRFATPPAPKLVVDNS